MSKQDEGRFKRRYVNEKGKSRLRDWERIFRRRKTTTFMCGVSVTHKRELHII